MDSIKPFIEAGWHTVPLKGKLERLEEGKKTLPKFEEGWRERYTTTFNDKITRIGGAITGEVSNIIAIDCDNTSTYELFRSLDPEYDFVFESLGKKDYNCGTIVYQYDEDLPYSFSLADGNIQLDIYSNNGFVYLPTEANKTKVAFNGHMPTLKEMPNTVKLLLTQLHALKTKVGTKAKPAVNSSVGNCLAPLVEHFVKSETYMPGLFKVITPKAFRDEKDYVKQGHLHPNKIPDGRGSEYLSKISAILGADPSVNRDLYVLAMQQINSLWDEPMDEARLDQTICDPMIEGRTSTADGPIWKYDKDWHKNRLVLQTKRQTNIEIGFDDTRGLYYVVDSVREWYKTFSRDTELQSYIESAVMHAPKKAQLKKDMPVIDVGSHPDKQFGFSLADITINVRTLNTFKQTPELSILHKPELYKDMYTRPSTTIKYLETLIPEESMRNYLLGFIKRKLLTFEYSPVILYFLGVHGSGKDTFVQMLETIMGKMSRPTTKEFLEIYNGWLLDTHFIQLDEYGNQLTRVHDREEALGKLKSFTGKSKVWIRTMRNDGFDYNHSATFIMTSNKNPLMFEDGDRRIALLPTPNKLDAQEWVRTAGGINSVYNQIMQEIPDFCYWLATEVDVVSKDQYVVPPESEGKRELIANSMYAAQRIAYVLKHGMFSYFKNLAIEYECDKMVKAIDKKRILDVDMEELYDAMTDNKGDMRSLNKAIRGAGIEMVRTTHNAMTVQQYIVKGFEDNPFEEEDDE